MPIDTVPLIGFDNVEVLNLTYVENTGAAFGMLKNHRWAKSPNKRVYPR